jgi:hypothetical protein
MKWREVRTALQRKTDSKDENRARRHNRIWVEIDGKTVGPVLLSRSSGEMKDREIGNCARSLTLNEHSFRQFVACTMDRDGFASAVSR